MHLKNPVITVYCMRMCIIAISALTTYRYLDYKFGIASGHLHQYYEFGQFTLLSGFLGGFVLKAS